MPFSDNDIPSLAGKVAIVTGGTSGLGYATAHQLAKAGADVIITARNDEKGQKAVAELKALLGDSAKISYAVLNNEDLHSVEAFARSFGETHDSLDILVNNAGIGMPPWKPIHGVESQILVNHLSHFHLTNLLLPKLEKAGELHGDARIVNVSSAGHGFARPSATNPNVVDWVKANEENSFEGARNYGFSKLAQIHHVAELTKRLGPGSKIRANAVHPGSVHTNIAGSDKQTSSWFGRAIGFFINTFGSSPNIGALTQLYLAASPEVVTKDIRGKYFVPVAKEQLPTPLGRSDEGAVATWKWSEETVARILQEQH
ncbi:uncharacterized protein BJ171DRAFT_457108 [Polychytrium aggregatum]|uniref:uncharacterized protein n=1 Tax=Polychytrium aggregatum TaxID=110093 RepID=UPI0022FEF7F0|nr:uncharacterized protein BJ171DRAFT_457108 [Polychytrium aggregatum]KAI9206660.1 hypothetical protein BJ171DRAFT_457108 [Polychytrium aggregatum]